MHLHRAALFTLLAALVSPGGAGNLVANADVEAHTGDQPEAWFPTAFNDKAKFAWAEDPDHKGNHALSITKADPANREAHNWVQTVELPGTHPARLELITRVRSADMKLGASSCVMVQVIDGKDVLGYAWSDKTEEDTGWHTVSSVFEVPKQAKTVTIRAYLTGAGTVLFDDFDLHASTKALKSSDGKSPPAPPSPYETYVRKSASEIPWMFDAEAAKKRAASDKKPLLVYVRCIDKHEALAAAQKSLTADEVPFTDDGLRKDVLMRAGPLSDPDVGALIERRFVPLLLTYELAAHGGAPVRPDPLTPVGLSASEVVTPALAVFDAQGKPVHLLHRIGTQSVFFVDSALRAALDKARVPSAPSTKGADASEMFLDGELERAIAVIGSASDEPSSVLISRCQLRLGRLDAASAAVEGLQTPQAHLQRALVSIARGEHENGLRELEQAELPKSDAREPLVRFEKAWCLRLLLRHADAQNAWTELAGDTRWGRKAAACLLEKGPHLDLSETQIIVIPNDPLGRQTESVATKVPWEPRVSIAFLLGQQRSDGSFGAHDGSHGDGYWDAAISGLTGQALRAWRPKLDAPMQAAVDAALVKLGAFLTEWSQRPVQPASGAFDHPYALLYLLDVHDEASAARVIDSIAKSQNPDGNWTVYQAARPASFNTALNVMALAKAKAAGLAVPQAVLDSGVKALEAMRTKRGLFPYSTMAGHEWMTTEWASIARDPLCEHALLIAGRKTKPAIDEALGRFLEHESELRAPTKKYYDYFNSRGHGGYYFFFAHRNAIEAAQWAPEARRKKVAAAVRDAVVAAREFDGTWMDQVMLGRVYGTAMALSILAQTD